MPGPSSSTRDEQRAVRRGRAPTRTWPPRAAVQRGVVEEVVDQQAQAAAPAADRRASSISSSSSYVDPRMAPPRGVHARRRRGRRARRPRAGGCSAASPRASACRPSSRWTIRSCSAAMSRDERGALGGGEVGVAGERVEVRAQAGERRAQLVAGVGGEAARRVQGALRRRRRGPQAREHLVERAGERADLDRPLVVGQRRAEVRGAAHARGARRAAGASGRTASVVKPHAASAVSAERGEADHEHEAAEVVRARLRPARGSRASWRRGPVAVRRRATTVSERHSRRRSRSSRSRRGPAPRGVSAGTSPPWS